MLTLSSISFVLFAGLGFSLMNTAYRLGTQQNIPVQPIAFIVALAGTTYYVAATWPVPFWHISWHVWGLGAIVGVSQYALVLLIAAALRNGPLSPMIGSKYFGFVLVILMARLVWNETLSGMQAVGVALAILTSYFSLLTSPNPSTMVLALY